MQNSQLYQDGKRTNLHRKQVCPCFYLQKQEWGTCISTSSPFSRGSFCLAHVAINSICIFYLRYILLDFFVEHMIYVPPFLRLG